jgi:hypothetical protein
VILLEDGITDKDDLDDLWLKEKVIYKTYTYN